MSLVANPLGTKIISSRFAYLTWVKISISIVIFMLHITSVSKVVFVYENCQILLTTLVSCLQFNELSFQQNSFKLCGVGTEHKFFRKIFSYVLRITY